MPNGRYQEGGAVLLNGHDEETHSLVFEDTGISELTADRQPHVTVAVHAGQKLADKNSCYKRASHR